MRGRKARSVARAQERAREFFEAKRSSLALRGGWRERERDAALKDKRAVLLDSTRSLK